MSGMSICSYEKVTKNVDLIVYKSGLVFSGQSMITPFSPQTVFIQTRTYWGPSGTIMTKRNLRR